MPKVIPCISVYSPLSPAWRWYAAELSNCAEWRFFNEEPRWKIEHWVRRPRVSRILNAFRCIRDGISAQSEVYAAHSQYSTFWLAIALMLLGVDKPLLSFSFHFPELPVGFRRMIMKRVFRRVTEFTVHSELERKRYSAHFQVAVERFHMMRWGVAPSTVEIENDAAVIPGRYICAIGKDGRDYATLVKAMRHLPDLNLVIVAQPYNINQDSVPNNVKIFFSVSNEMAMNILKHSEFMALPLKAADTCCGHITIVSAMYCGKAIVITRSEGIADYFPHCYESTQVAPGEVDGWVTALKAMAEDPLRRERCAAMGREFALEHCSEDAAIENTVRIFRETGIEIAHQPEGRVTANVSFSNEGAQSVACGEQP